MKTYPKFFDENSSERIKYEDKHIKHHQPSRKSVNLFSISKIVFMEKRRFDIHDMKVLKHVNYQIVNSIFNKRFNS